MDEDRTSLSGTHNGANIGATAKETNTVVNDEDELSTRKCSASKNAVQGGRRLGHWRVGEDGEVTFKRLRSSWIVGSIQLGVAHAVGSLAHTPDRDLLMMDFTVVQTTHFPKEGGACTPAHRFSDFKFRAWAPVAFRYFRALFGIRPEDFLLSLCSRPLLRLSNPGASGSIFYVTSDDSFVLKTLDQREARFLQKLLPGYYLNINQNPRTLLPKFFGLYCYECGGRTVRLVVMNNLLPRSPPAPPLHEKYDLKGSTYKRRANRGELRKREPTFKDLDFVERHPDGLLLEPLVHAALLSTLRRDCRVLESFKIMDYSLLLAVHKLDTPPHPHRVSVAAAPRLPSLSPLGGEGEWGGIPARNARGERLLLHLGIIDILQSFVLKKRLEHALKAIVHDGDTVSVHRPGFYAHRFLEWMCGRVFRPSAPSLRHTPSRRKGRKKMPLSSTTDQPRVCPGTSFDAKEEEASVEPVVM